MNPHASMLRLLAPLPRLWWRLARPRTFGVKALIVHPDGARFLVVRHSYTDVRRWGLPGGGYRPGRESPTRAAAREVREELRLSVDPETCTIVTTVVTTLEGKHDTLTIVTAPAIDDEFRCSAEIAEARWIADPSELGPDAPTSRWLRLAIDRAAPSPSSPAGTRRAAPR